MEGGPAGGPRRDLKMLGRRGGRAEGGRRDNDEKIRLRRGIRDGDSVSLGDERRAGTRGGRAREGAESRKANLTFISGDSRLCTEKNPFKRRIPRARDRVEYEEGGHVGRKSVHKL